MRNIRTTKQFFFFFLKPLWPVFRVASIKLRIIEDIKVRQKFPIGFLKDEIDIEEIKKYLTTLGFFSEKMAFVDPDEILGMRKLDPENKTFQYHVRIYKDKEVRGHYEKTPEDAPIEHFKEISFDSREEDFKEIFRDFIKSF